MKTKSGSRIFRIREVITIIDKAANAFLKVVETYGPEKANGILAVIRMIMFGNALGITSGFFTDRFKGHRDPDSRMFTYI